MKFAYVLLSILAVANAAPLVAGPAGEAGLVARAETNEVAARAAAVPSLPLDNVNTLLQDALKNVKGLTGDLISDVQKLVDGLLTGGLPDLGSLLNILAQPASVQAEILKVLNTVVAGSLPLAGQVLKTLTGLLGGTGLNLATAVHARAATSAINQVQDQLKTALAPLNLPVDVLNKVIAIVVNLLQQLISGLGGKVNVGNFGSLLTKNLQGLPIDASVITSIVGIVVGLLGSLVTGLLGGILGAVGGGVGGLLGGILGGVTGGH